MPYQSLGQFIDAADRMGDVKFIQGADRDRDVGCLTELGAEYSGPLLVFDRFDGFDPTFRVASNVHNNRRRYALALDLPPDAHPIELAKMLRRRQRGLELIAPTIVDDGPILSQQLAGDDVDVGLFPAPTWHSRDGGRYIGTGDIILMRDPETGLVNYGTYRACVQGRDRLSVWILQHKAGRIIAEKYWRAGLPCPVAVVLGCEPVTFLVATSGRTGRKYDYAGALRGEPVSVLPGTATGIPVPSEAEIVFEGHIPPPEEETAAEGPFGEWPGYYSHTGPECVIRVERISYRDEPIIYGSPPLRPILHWDSDLPGNAALMWEHLERSGISDVAGVWGHCNGLMVVIALRQRYAGHARQALLAAAGLRSGASMYSTYVAVDDDIDPSNMRDVLWALCTRVNPDRALQVIPSAWTSDLDPRLTPVQKESGDFTIGRTLIDACRPFAWRESFPDSNVFSADERADVSARWRSLIEELAHWQPTLRAAAVGS
ncbi:MAG TPA: UbiD family decarboxylase [Chloroflexota bacterium]|nr:UbiD family decarboxylase [Chloroflexota bacterium]